jgi:hypothetical protein
LLVDHNPNEARALLRPLGFSVHRSSMADTARAIVTAIDAGDLAAALRVTEQEAGEDDGEPGADSEDTV